MITPIYKRLDGKEPLILLAFGKVSIAVLSCPLGALLFCIIYSILLNFERSTATHCDVPNFLPSISAAIGSYEPQTTVWRVGIYLHLPARLAIARVYYKYYHTTIKRNHRLYATIACLLNAVENLALMGLSTWNSTDSYPIHRNFFIAFIVCSELYMIISYFLNKYGRRSAMTSIEEKSLKYKGYCFLTNVISFCLAGYCFVRHNSKCEPGVYTLFALFEYIVVLTNMGYHMTAYWDFYKSFIAYDQVNGLYLTQN